MTLQTTENFQLISLNAKSRKGSSLQMIFKKLSSSSTSISDLFDVQIVILNKIVFQTVIGDVISNCHC